MSRLLASIFFLFICSAQVAWAQVDTDSFVVRIYAGSDVTAPSTPTILTATSTAQTQIDITWSSSTDNTILAGYVVSRDGSPVATTSLLAYSDTGLTSSTTYVYTVQAFDTSYNYSSSSNPATTTTLAPPPTPPPPVTPSSTRSTAEGTAARVVADTLYIETGISTSSFVLRTTHPARVELRWGKTTDYELGYIVNNVYRRDHLIDLADLEPGTTYRYELIGYTPRGVQSVIESGSFTTKELKIITPPPNVSWFTAIQDDLDVQLSWVIPDYDEISHVRIVRSHFGFPAHPQDGAIVYQGAGARVTDDQILSQYSPLFYTAFVYSHDGLVSSGAVASVYGVFSGGELNDLTDPGNESTPVGLGVGVPTDLATSTIVSQRVTPHTKLPDLFDILITQDDLVYSFGDSGITLPLSKAFTVSVPKEVVSNNLKSLIVTLQDPTNNKQQYSFLLRINRDGTAYEATINAFEAAGHSRIVLEIYDYEAFVVGSYQNMVMFGGVVTPDAREEAVVFPDVIFEQYQYVLGFLLFLFVLLLIIFIIGRRRDDEEDEDNG